jgi:inosine-uridine nucleoside N-ribohydrolase
MITMDLCSQAVFTERHLAVIKHRNSDMARYITRFVEPWLRLNRRIFFRKKGFFPWDVVAAAYLVDRSLFDEDHRTFSIREKGPRRGSLIPLSSSGGTAPPEGTCRADAPGSLDTDRFMDLFLSRLQ